MIAADGTDIWKGGMNTHIEVVLWFWGEFLDCPRIWSIVQTVSGILRFLRLLLLAPLFFLHKNCTSFFSWTLPSLQQLLLLFFLSCYIKGDNRITTSEVTSYLLPFFFSLFLSFVWTDRYLLLPFLQQSMKCNFWPRKLKSRSCLYNKMYLMHASEPGSVFMHNLEHIYRIKQGHRHFSRALLKFTTTYERYRSSAFGKKNCFIKREMGTLLHS